MTANFCILTVYKLNFKKNITLFDKLQTSYSCYNVKYSTKRQNENNLTEIHKLTIVTCFNLFSKYNFSCSFFYS